ncbi:MAG: Gfo/Idh/MocA family oxidoreductase [Alphaproteobacteria bacterium]|nr:Gfo/Idh/MocA family oxidoreductase [Alphaproteobacteria bacterium]MBU0796180.1 Gfo/Idh/MocA family oxidoreductase [Alphaproteobacteria bacterium]MBU0887204.1 Gfo/Idh/MocA family oxidoreductase [Alphaproteobacteria bacterium]MBU1812268.1 Gfo/Idh/MocA family oxidoreductase [Alphaproteobacteria bacterium]
MAHKIGFIGLGIMGQRMLNSMADHKDFEAVLAWDPSPEAMTALASDRPAIRQAASAEALIADPEVECVYIASPPKSHLAYAMASFDAGKAVFCEKPLAVDLAEAGQVTARAQEEGRKAVINFPFASSLAGSAIQEAIAQGSLGRIQQVEIQVAFAKWPRGWQEGAAGWLARREEGGFTREVLSHFLFLTRRTLGPLSIRAVKVDYPDDGKSAETGIEAEMRAGEVPVRLIGRVEGEKDDHNRWTITGDKGALRISDWMTLERFGESGWQPVDLGPGELRPRSVRNQLDQLSLMLKGKPHRLASFEEGYAVQSCVEALLGQHSTA